ncbi:MAG: HAMP domain-containing sensor histidine kinase [Oceanicaulis sp.]
MGSTFSMHGFMPHGMCYLWRPDLLWLHVGSDAVIALSYFSIPAAMAVFASRRPDLAYRPVVWLFTAFIVLCGMTHAFSIWTVWTPHYYAAGLLKAATALASLATAVALWPLLPRALTLPSRDDLTAKNEALEQEVVRRGEAETQLTALAAQLERRVEQRTVELERANAALNQFATTASHDLRAPLRHIGLFAELIERDEAALSDKGRDYLGRITDSADRLQTLVTALLTYAKLVNTPPQTRPTDLESVAQAAIEARRPEIEAAGAVMTLNAMPRAQADAVLIERVFDNLIANALKYHDGAAPPEITIEGRDDGSNAVITVTDNGPGVPAEQAERAFDMLTRLETNGAEGAGVGLAFCRTIVESHGGTIRLDTDHQGGARFVFTLPLV